MRPEARKIPAAVAAPAFSLVELLVVVAVLGLLITILAPALARARLLAKVTKAKAELANIATALEVYHNHHQAYPPARTYCEYGDTVKAPDWAELPIELARGGYLPAAPPEGNMTVEAEDPFNPGRTYKYLAPGLGFHNGAGTYIGLWVPENFPHGDSSKGKDYSNPDDSPVMYVLWSVGTLGDIGYWNALARHHPLNPQEWFPGKDEKGIIVRVRMKNGQFVLSQ